MAKKQLDDKTKKLLIGAALVAVPFSGLAFGVFLIYKRLKKAVNTKKGVKNEPVK